MTERFRSSKVIMPFLPIVVGLAACSSGSSSKPRAEASSSVPSAGETVCLTNPASEWKYGDLDARAKALIATVLHISPDQIPGVMYGPATCDRGLGDTDVFSTRLTVQGAPNAVGNLCVAITLNPSPGSDGDRAVVECVALGRPATTTPPAG